MKKIVIFITIFLVIILLGFNIFNKTNKKTEFNDLNISKIEFNKILGDINITLEENYLVSLGFNYDGKINIESLNSIKNLNLSLKNEIEIKDYYFDQNNNIKNYYHLNLMIYSKNEISNLETQNIYINENKYNIGNIYISANKPNDDFKVNSAVALGKNFKEYFCEITNNKEIKINKYSLGKLNEYYLNATTNTNEKNIEFNEKINNNSKINININYKNSEKIINNYDFIILSPRVIYNSDGKNDEKIFYLPNCVYEIK